MGASQARVSMVVGLTFLAPEIQVRVLLEKRRRICHKRPLRLARWRPEISSSAVEPQATDRVYRIGQEREVHVRFPILKDYSGRLPATLDERIHDLLNRKQSLASDFLNPGSTEDQNLRELYRELEVDAVAVQ